MMRDAGHRIDGRAATRERTGAIATRPVISQPMVALLTAMLGLSPGCARQAPADAPRLDSRTIERLKRERDALRELTSGTLTLAEAVRQAGGQLTLDASPNPDDFRLRDIESLTHESQLVVLARRHGEPRVVLAEDARSIVTRYEMAVDAVVRPAPHAGRTRLVVELPGGRLSLPEGEAAAINGPTLQSDATYLLFLQTKASFPPARQGEPQAATAPPDVFVVTGAHYEGIFPIDKASTVRPAGTPPAIQTQQQYSGRSVVSLVAAVRATR